MEGKKDGVVIDDDREGGTAGRDLPTRLGRRKIAAEFKHVPFITGVRQRTKQTRRISNLADSLPAPIFSETSSTSSISVVLLPALLVFVLQKLMACSG